MATTTLDPYAALGIPAGASRDEAARAHRRLAKQFHPDVNSGPAAAERMRRINEAWRILSNPARRARYDSQRTTASRPGHGYGTRTRAAPWPADGYGPRTTATWTTWPESRQPAAPRGRRPARPDPVEPSFGDRPVVFVAAWALLALLLFVGTWLGSVAR
jgi:curved DNA-binding protein CbpA